MNNAEKEKAAVAAEHEREKAAEQARRAAAEKSRAAEGTAAEKAARDNARSLHTGDAQAASKEADRHNADDTAALRNAAAERAVALERNAQSAAQRDLNTSRESAESREPHADAAQRDLNTARESAEPREPRAEFPPERRSSAIKDAPTPANTATSASSPAAVAARQARKLGEPLMRDNNKPEEPEEVDAPIVIPKLTATQLETIRAWYEEDRTARQNDYDRLTQSRDRLVVELQSLMELEHRIFADMARRHEHHKHASPRT